MSIKAILRKMRAALFGTPDKPRRPIESVRFDENIGMYVYTNDRTDEVRYFETMADYECWKEDQDERREMRRILGHGRNFHDDF